MLHSGLRSSIKKMMNISDMDTKCFKITMAKKNRTTCLLVFYTQAMKKNIAKSVTILKLRERSFK